MKRVEVLAALRSQAEELLGCLAVHVELLDGATLTQHDVRAGRQKPENEAQTIESDLKLERKDWEGMPT